MTGVAGSDGVTGTGADYAALLAERGAKIAALEGKITEPRRRPKRLRSRVPRWTSCVGRAMNSR